MQLKAFITLLKAAWKKIPEETKKEWIEKAKEAITEKIIKR